MIDNLFIYALGIFFLNETISLFIISIAIFISCLIAIMTILKKWGDGY